MRAAISQEKLEEILHVKTATIRVYLCRQGLRHIKYFKGVFYNISEEDVETLRGLIRYRKGYKKQQEVSSLTNAELKRLKEEFEIEIENKRIRLQKIENEIEKRKATNG